MPKVVLDTNVLISAIVFGGNPREILQIAVAGGIGLVISEDIFAEFQAVLARPQFGLTSQLVHGAAAELASLAEWVTPLVHMELVKDDPADNLILDCAVAAGADYLISGDSHLLKLGTCGKVQIVSPQEFLKAFGSIEKEETGG